MVQHPFKPMGTSLLTSLGAGASPGFQCSYAIRRKCKDQIYLALVQPQATLLGRNPEKSGISVLSYTTSGDVVETD